MSFFLLIRVFLNPKRPAARSTDRCIVYPNPTVVQRTDLGIVYGPSRT